MIAIPHGVNLVVKAPEVMALSAPPEPAGLLHEMQLKNRASPMRVTAHFDFMFFLQLLPDIQ
jgi:hypothetical protein